MRNNTGNRKNNSSKSRNSSYEKTPKKSGRRGGSSRIAGTDSSVGVLKVLAGLVFVAIFARLLYLQVVKAPEYSEMAVQAHVNRRVNYAKRGTIYDRNGNVLAKSVECREIYANPSAIKSPAEYAKVLSAELGGEEDYYYDLLTQDGTFVYIARGLDVDQAEKIVNIFRERKLPGIEMLPNTKRIYPFGALANQVLGLVNIDGEGISGLELQYNDVLKGTDGLNLQERGANGLPIAGGENSEKEVVDGKDIVLSLDVNIQQIAENKAVEAQEKCLGESASIIVMHPKTGEILAMCSTPLADFSDMETLKPESMTLIPISHSFDPGSSFKTFTIATALDNNVITPSTTFDVPVSIKVGDDTVKDAHERYSSELMTPTDIMRVSSNVGTVMIAERLGKTAFAQGVARFGIGEKTGIDYPGETPGIVTPLNEYTGATLGAMSFGQSLSVPFIQIARGIGAIANGGVMTTPHFALTVGNEELKWPERPEKACTKEAASQVTEMMRQVVKDGTGRSAKIDGLDIAAKTATGEIPSPNGGYLKDIYTASFVGFANADDPEILIYVGVNKTPLYGGDSSGVIFADVLREAALDLGMKKSN